MLTDEQIAEIAERVTHATPGPWSIGFNGAMRSAWAVQRAGSSSPILHLDSQKNVDLDHASHTVDGDLDFIQHARTDVEELLAEVKKLREAVATLEGAASENERLEMALGTVSAQYERVRDALEFYASPSTYRQPAPPPAEPVPWIGSDLGRRARAALDKHEPLPPQA